MPKTIRNKYKENLTYEKLMLAHKESQKGKGYRREIIKFNLKQEELLKILKRKIKDEDVLWLLEEIIYAQKRPKGLEIGYRNFIIMESTFY